jgi:DNA-binding transcriptional MerR regulator
MKSRTYQVSEVAELSGLTIRALHHYDAIGLLVPRLRTAAGYRLYDDDLLAVLLDNGGTLPTIHLSRSGSC